MLNVASGMQFGIKLGVNLLLKVNLIVSHLFPSLMILVFLQRLFLARKRHFGICHYITITICMKEVYLGDKNNTYYDDRINAKAKRLLTLPSEPEEARACAPAPFPRGLPPALRTQRSDNPHPPSEARWLFRIYPLQP